jgi:hypothetical protein
MRTEKEKAGVFPTPLDEQSGYFREAFRQDSGMEVLHFLPLYFAEASRTELFAALEGLVVTREGIPPARTPRTELGLMAIGSTLPTHAQRLLLGEFLVALRAEWEGFYQTFRRGTVTELDTSGSVLQSLWDRTFSAKLAPFLDGLGLSGGTVALSPAIGDEGRIFSGVAQNSTDNVLVVAPPKAGEDHRVVIFSMLRELSFPLVRRVLGQSEGLEGSRQDEEERAARAAVRSGALILERFLPEELSAYQQFFLSRAGHPSPSQGALGEAFADAYPLESALVQGLREEASKTNTNGGEG